jgi:Fibronectin type III domain
MIGPNMKNKIRMRMTSGLIFVMISSIFIQTGAALETSVMYTPEIRDRNDIYLQWKQPQDADFTKVDVYLRTQGGTFQLNKTIDVSTTNTYLVENLAYNTTYDFYVKIYNSTTSVQSNTVSIKTETDPTITNSSSSTSNSNTNSTTTNSGPGDNTSSSTPEENSVAGYPISLLLISCTMIFGVYSIILNKKRKN